MVREHPDLPDVGLEDQVAGISRGSSRRTGQAVGGDVSLVLPLLLIEELAATDRGGIL